MVQQTRRVVEDYVLYRIHTALSTENYIPDEMQCITNEDATILMNGLPLPQQSPSKLNLALRNIAEKYERKYNDTFPDLLKEIRTANVSTTDVDHIFSKITKDLFKLPLKQIIPSGTTESRGAASNGFAAVQKVTTDDSHIKWGHVIALLVFAGILAVRAVECRSPETIDSIVMWVTRFIDTELSHWLAKQGGWEHLVVWSSESGRRNDYTTDSGLDPNSFSAGIRSIMSVGVLAACVGLGALMMTKK